ncbi:4Fe-4S dicluster domain-containing protein [Jhaorihella thermophila]
MEPEDRVIVAIAGLNALIGALDRDGYRVLGPTVRDGVIACGDISGVDELPAGWSDEQDGGRYRLTRSGAETIFGFTSGAQAWKRFLHPPRQRLWRATRDGDRVRVHAEPAPDERFAFIGVRACDLHAIAIQDRVLTEGAYPDPFYTARRKELFIVAVNCARAGGRVSARRWAPGRRQRSGFDIALTELPGEGGSSFVAQAGSPRGAALLRDVADRPATAEECAAAEAIVARTAASMGRAMPDHDLRALLLDNPDHPRWDDVADRCLTCGNCTMVCPTCFCTTTEDSADLSGTESTRTQRWESCFTMDFFRIFMAAAFGPRPARAIGNG